MYLMYYTNEKGERVYTLQVRRHLGRWLARASVLHGEVQATVVPGAHAAMPAWGGASVLPPPPPPLPPPPAGGSPCLLPAATCLPPPLTLLLPRCLPAEVFARRLPHAVGAPRPLLP
jgi:hypothetical protein